MLDACTSYCRASSSSSLFSVCDASFTMSSTRIFPSVGVHEENCQKDKKIDQMLQVVMGERTFVFRKVADELLDSFLSYCVLEISCRCCYLFRGHLAIMVPANYSETISKCWGSTCKNGYSGVLQMTYLLYKVIYPTWSRIFVTGITNTMLLQLLWQGSQ